MVSSDQHPYWDNISTSGTLDSKLAFSPIPPFRVASALQGIKADYSITTVTFTKTNHLLGKLPGTICKICLSLLTMHMSSWNVHRAQHAQHTRSEIFIACKCCFNWWSFTWHLAYSWPGPQSGLLVTHAFKSYSPTGEGLAGQQTVQQHSFLLTAAHSIPQL